MLSLGDPPDPGIGSASPASAGGFFTTEPPRSLCHSKFIQPCYPSLHCTGSVTADDPARNRLGRAQGQPSRAWRSLAARFGKEGLNRKVTTWHRCGFGQMTAALPSKLSPPRGDPGLADNMRPQGRYRMQRRGIAGVPSPPLCPAPLTAPASLPAWVGTGWVCPSRVRWQTRPGHLDGGQQCCLTRRVPGTLAE